MVCYAGLVVSSLSLRRGDDAFDAILSVWCFDFLDVDVMTFIRQKKPLVGAGA